jgi:uncharacterized protein YegJ (DUF2314 family)
MKIHWPLFLLVLTCSCARQPDLGEPIPPGNLRTERITFQFAVYYLPKPVKEPNAELRMLLSSKYSVFRQVENIDVEQPFPTLAARLESDPAANYAPPDPDYLEQFGVGLNAEQILALQRTESALILDFAYPREAVWSALRSALELTDELAHATGGLAWDETTRQTFTPDAWRERRIASWTEHVPDISRYTTIHTYRTGEYLHAITLGMEKFGLPDIVIDEFPSSLNRNVSITMNLFAQAIAEGPAIQKAGEYDLDIRAIKNPAVREPQISGLMENATGIALLSLKTGRWEEGDPPNRLIEITFERGAGPDVHSKQQDVISRTFGSEDSIIYDVEHDEELEAASQRARAMLPGLRSQFNRGLAPGEFLQVKIPFTTPDGGREWMWVEVISWKDDDISGLLRNEPDNVPALRAGQIVEVSESDVFDYIFTRADGSVEGNETSEIIEKANNAQ